MAASWKNKGTVLQRLNRIPAAVKTAVDKQLTTEVMDGLVPAQRRAAPVSSDLEKTPGEFRDSIYAYLNPRRDLSFIVLADAKDAKGNFIGLHIEAGHRTVDGKHVEARPSFFPTYRAWKKPARRRVRAAARAAFKAL